MITTQCPLGQDPRMCAHCVHNDTCTSRCDTTKCDVIWGEITGDLTDQTDLAAEFAAVRSEITHTASTAAEAAQSTASEALSTAQTVQSDLETLQNTLSVEISEILDLCALTLRVPIKNNEDGIPQFPEIISKSIGGFLIEYYDALANGVETATTDEAAKKLSRWSGGYVKFYTDGTPLFYTDDTQSLLHKQYFKPCLMRFYDRIVNLSEPFISVPTFDIVLTEDIIVYLEKLYGLSGAFAVQMTIDGAKNKYWQFVDADGKELLKIPF